MKTSLTSDNLLTVDLNNPFAANDLSIQNVVFKTASDDDDDDDSDDDSDSDDDDDDGDDDDDDDSGNGENSDDSGDTNGGVIITESDTVFYGFTEFYIEGRSTQVTTKSTNLGILSAKANLFTAKSIDSSVTLSITHAGSISNSIGSIDDDGNVTPPTSGGISQADIETALASNYSLVLLSLTRQEILNIIEYGVAASGNGTFPSRFPQVDGLVFSYDPNQPAGKRVRSLAITDEDGTVIDIIVKKGKFQKKSSKKASYRIVTTDFLADGGEGYTFSDSDITLNRININNIDTTTINVDTDIVINNQVVNFASFGSQQGALAKYLATNYRSTSYNVQETTIDQDVVIQNISVRSDTVVNINSQTFFLTGSADKDKIFGGNLDDKLRGKGGNDRLVGRDGDDTLRGNGGNDRVICGDGNDTAIGNSGDDRILCGDGDDLAIGGGGNDIIRGGDGDDNIKGGNGNDRIFGDKGDDTIDGGKGNDVIRGDKGDDVIRGAKGDDVIRGGQGDDMLFGDGGDDVLYANGGTTLLDGGIGEDILVGGKGDDTFVIAEVDSTTTILNFNAKGEDILQFESLEFDDLDISQFGNDTLIQVDDENLAVLINVNASTITEDVIVTLNGDRDSSDNDSDDSDDDTTTSTLVGTRDDDIFIITDVDSTVTQILNFNVRGSDILQFESPEFESLEFDDLNIIQSDDDTVIQINQTNVVVLVNVEATTITEELIITVDSDDDDGDDNNGDDHLGDELCDRLGKPQSLTFTYKLGTDVLTGQDEDKATVVGDPDNDDLAYIIVSSKNVKTKKDGTSKLSGGKTYFAGEVDENDDFTADVDFDNGKKFKSKTFIHVFDDEQAFLDGDAPLQTMEYHTSCSQAIQLGDTIGSIELVSYVGESGTATLS